MRIPTRPSRRRPAVSLLPGRRLAPRHPVLAALGRADQAALRFMRTHGHHEPAETIVRALGFAGEYAAVWVAIAGVGAAVDERRRRQWLTAAVSGPFAVGVNLAVKVAVGRQRPLIEEHPALARAPTKLSFPSAHATSSVAAAVALGRVQPRARPHLYTLATAICAGRPYLGMHYPSDVLAGAVLGAVIGGIVPGLGHRPPEERLFELAVDPDERAQASRRALGNGGIDPDAAIVAEVADGPDPELA